MISSPSNFKKKTRTTQGHGKYSPPAIPTPETNKSQDNKVSTLPTNYYRVVMLR